jgi:hypothetical protein
MMLTPIKGVVCDFGWNFGGISATRCCARPFLPMSNSKHSKLYAHSVAVGANSSLLTPRHRCYALLSSALSRLVLERECNSYQARQDGLW